jgi:hypothetical protein
MPIKIFVKCWIIYWVLVIIAPFHAIVDSPWTGIALQFLFFVAVIAGYFSVPGSYRVSKIEQMFPKPDKTYIRLFRLSIILSLLGTLCLTFDRTIIQGISFTDGLAVAREKWRLAGEARGGSVSSIYSVLGYLLAPAFYYAIINLVIYRSIHKSRKWKWILILTLIAWNSVLTGGRSVAFVALIMFASAHAYHRQFFFDPNWKSWSGFLRRKNLPLNKKSLSTAIVIVLLLSYSLYIFSVRSVANGMSVYEYVDQALNGLGLQMYSFISTNKEFIPFSEGFYLVTLFLGYILHSYVVTTKIFMYPYENDALIIFSGFGLILSKIGIIDPPKTDWFLAGSFSSLPGSLYMQGGLSFMVIFGISIGLLVRINSLYIYKYPHNSMLLFLYVILTSILIASPVLFIFDSLMFPFILIQFVLFSLLLKYRIRLTMIQRQFV